MRRNHRRSQHSLRLHKVLQHSTLTQETDVLDTWFSSGLLPFTVFGWPGSSTDNGELTTDNSLTPDIAAFYPTQQLVTGFDILFFWVARMIMLSCHFMLDVPMPDGTARTLADAVPFRNVYIHALVRDADRQKISKTKGNVIDPIEIVTKYGTDAVRFTLAAQASPGTDIAFNEARTEGYRAFANKIWNAARFLQMNIDRGREAGYKVSLSGHDSVSLDLPETTPLETRWIFSRLSTVSDSVAHSLADLPLRRSRQRRLPVLLGRVLRLVPRTRQAAPQLRRPAQRHHRPHPQRPRQRLRSRPAPALALHALPHRRALARPLRQRRQPHRQRNPSPSRAIRAPKISPLTQPPCCAMTTLQDLIVTIRGLRKELAVPEKESTPIQLHASAAISALAHANADMLSRLARVSTVELASATLTGNNARSTPAFDVAVLYERQIDVPAERERLTKDLAKFTKGLEAADKQLGNEGFIARAPAHIVEGLRKQHAETLALKQKAEAALAALPSE